MENKLLQKIAEGDQKALHSLYHLYNKKVYNTALGYLQNVEESEEITQDVFLTVFNKACSFKGNSKVSTWIYRITINKSLNQLEKRNRRPTSDRELKEHYKIDFEHPGVLLEHKEKSKYLFAVIDTLAEKQKTAFILSYVENLPRQEVADIMNTSLKSVESLLQRAKSNLKKKLISIYPEGNKKK
ncbi:sigma-70 family RNA polymerase sigma factor [Cellulophaga baltica]|uniref:RNA polymerase sigma factor n=1 Tax=Cellulophaga TaxID=104264 RepID=UPI001C07BF24|nr:sigma-70 family RNA polymerase sigma factor [Cellulophaga sp. 1_MG-2023]MBU2997088.1 sigma-70 family RNA polymerase sigma factor [Cellulophaga baltica]MDO6768486.1 sigma-70 family RNA polymerase sigma factor [Cellulophaga sp. 1_MG-2023]